MTKSNLALKRVYEPPLPGDGIRILVDRLWPRGLSKEEARIDRWMKELGPSTGLRKWFNHDPDRWIEFQRRYRDELTSEERVALIEEVRRLSATGKVSLLYAARDTEHNNAVVLSEIVSR
ncbi:MAG: DUF488 family protein [Bauldia sp.]|nr:DUF488 family protein [Bauldia sp.]